MAEQAGLEALYARRFDLVDRICFLFLKNPSDAEDATSVVFLCVLESAVQFASEEHEKAWLIRTTRNVCKNEQRRKARQHLSLDDDPANRDRKTEPHFLPEDFVCLGRIPRAAGYLGTPANHPRGAADPLKTIDTARFDQSSGVVF